MKVYTVRDNLKKTIADKEQHLKVLNATLATAPLENTEFTVIRTTSMFLEANLDELKGILRDVEECCKEATALAFS